MPQMRFNVVDAAGTVSLVGPAHLMKMFTAACAKAPADCQALLGLTERYDPSWTWEALKVLEAPATDDESEPMAFRVTDEQTRHRSLVPVEAGLVVYNLMAKRIIQIENSYGELMRKDRGRLRRDGRPVRAYYWYELPAEWSIVP